MKKDTKQFHFFPPLYKESHEEELITNFLIIWEDLLNSEYHYIFYNKDENYYQLSDNNSANNLIVNFKNLMYAKNQFPHGTLVLEYSNVITLSIQFRRSSHNIPTTAITIKGRMADEYQNQNILNLLKKTVDIYEEKVNKMFLSEVTRRQETKNGKIA